MRLRIVTPLDVVADEEIRSLRAEDASGSFGVLPGHADFLTALSLSVASWTDAAGATRHCAVRGGVLTVLGGATVVIATREAVAGDDLATLDQTVLARFRSDFDAERAERTEDLRLQMGAVRQLVSRLKPRKGLQGPP